MADHGNEPDLTTAEAVTAWVRTGGPEVAAPVFQSRDRDDRAAARKPGPTSRPRTGPLAGARDRLVQEMYESALAAAQKLAARATDAGLYAGLIALFRQHPAAWGDGAWLPRLARGARECRHFLAVICPEYLSSEFCAAELSRALATDIQNRRHKVLPFVIDNVDALPDHCSHLQVVRAAGTGVPDRLRSLLRPLLGE